MTDRRLFDSGAPTFLEPVSADHIARTLWETRLR